MLGGEDAVTSMVALSVSDKVTEEPIAKPARLGRFNFLIR